MLDREPNWQPISRLPQITAIVEGGIALAKEQLALMREGIEQPYRLDNATVERTIRVFTTTRNDLTELFGPQGERWASNGLGATRQKEVDHYRALVAQELGLVNDVLSTAEQLKDSTIEALLRKSDLEVGIEAAVRDLIQTAQPPQHDPHQNDQPR